MCGSAAPAIGRLRPEGPRADIVALVSCRPGSALTSGPELRGQGRWLQRWVAVAAVGGGAGAALLLLTPPGVFARLVPFLVALGSLALLLPPRLAGRHAERRPRIISRAPTR